MILLVVVNIAAPWQNRVGGKNCRLTQFAGVTAKAVPKKYKTDRHAAVRL